MENRKAVFGDGSEMTPTSRPKSKRRRRPMRASFCVFGQQSHQCQPASDDTPGMHTGYLSGPERMRTMRSSLLPSFRQVTLNS